MDFGYTSSKQQGVTVFNLQGEIIDKVQATGFLDEVTKLIASGQNKFVLDLSGLKYMNSSGLNVLVNTLTKARNAGGEVSVCNLSKKVSELLVITKLDSIFHILPTLDEAIKNLK
jgi:anti-sigma B factor antagonist